MNNKLINIKGETISSAYTYQDLMALYNELDELHRGPLGWLLNNRFKAFKRANGPTYNQINKELYELQKDFCEMVPAQSNTLKEAMAIKMERDESGKMMPVMLPGKTLKDYMMQQEILLAKKCNIVGPRPMDY